LGFFFKQTGRWQKENTKGEEGDKTKTKKKTTPTPKKKKETKQNKTNRQTEISLRSIIFVYAHIVSIKDVRVEKILPREERRAGSRARATARLSLGE
jgi:hypothetical protein